MKAKLTLCVVLCAALLSACSSQPELPQPSGDWVDANPPATVPPSSPGVRNNV